jgi:tetratricopeptide (TPR) repeat protein
MNRGRRRVPVELVGKMLRFGKARAYSTLQLVAMTRQFFAITLASALLTGCAGLVHVPPGNSVEVVLAQKPEVLKTPEPPPQMAMVATSGTAPGAYIKPVEPELPTNDRVEAVAEAFTRGKDAFDAGENDAAISAFEQAVELEPTFAEAWKHLAIAYEKAGKADKAKQAFRHSKDLAQQ